VENAPRIAPLEPPFEPPVAEALRRRMPKNSPVPPLALFRLFAKDPRLADALEPLGRFNLKYAPGLASSLSPRDREIVIDRVCARCGCEYEWGVHIAFFAGQVNLTDDQVRATVLGDASEPAFSARDRLLVELVDSLHDHGSVNDELWSRLAAEFSETELLHALVLAGWYHVISYVANGARLPLEPWAAHFPEPAPR
jgi:4-carboxymuconolactone decarboxylase